MREKITSVANARIKNVVRLRQHQDRLQAGLTIVEGRREIARALTGKVVFDSVYVCEGAERDTECAALIARYQELKRPLYDVSAPVFEKLSYGERNEGLIGVCHIPTVSFKDLSLSARPFFIVLEAIEKPGNIGAVLRTADGMGATGVLVSDPRTDVYNPNIIRASLGTVFTVPVVSCTNEQARTFLSDNRITVCVATPDAAGVYTQGDLTRPTAIVFGSEQDGVSDFWLGHADARLCIPMRGSADSLNVSIAAAVIAYEALRQRTEK